MTESLCKPPRPWHLLLVPFVPFGALLLSHLDVVPPDALLWPVAAAALLALFLWLAFARVVQDRRVAALGVSFFVAVLLAHRSSRDSMAGAFGLPAAILVDTFFVCLLIIIVARRRDAAALTSSINQALLAVVVLLVMLVGHAEITRPRHAAAPLAGVNVGYIETPPDVYVLVLDGYGRADVLRELYGFENGLVGELRGLGFFVADLAASNYAQTAPSLASALNIDYLDTIIGTIDPGTTSRRGLADLIDRNRTFSLFERAGYEIRAYASSYDLVRPGPAHLRPTTFGHVGTFELAAYEATWLPTLFEALGMERGWLPLFLHRRHVRWMLDDLSDAAGSVAGRPRLTFAHLIAPHPPFAFMPNGAPRRTRLPALWNDGSHWHAIAAGSGETYGGGYVQNVQFLNERVSRIVRDILTNGRPSIVLVHGDHGPGGHLDWENPDASHLLERHGILLAMRLPEGATPLVENSTTPINAYRSLINEALGLRLPPLDDRSYFATWSRPFSFLDVTDHLRASESHPDTGKGRQ